MKITISTSENFYNNHKNYYLKSKICCENHKNYYLKSKHPRCRVSPSSTVENSKFSSEKVKFYKVIFRAY